MFVGIAIAFVVLLLVAARLAYSGVNEAKQYKEDNRLRQTMLVQKEVAGFAAQNQAARRFKGDSNAQ